MKSLFLVVLLILTLSGCSEDKGSLTEDGLYFPPDNGYDWESIPPGTLGWDETALENLFSFLETNNTRAFIILNDGKIVIEKYWGNTITGTKPFDASSQWYWASAGKTITATLIGIAQQEGEVNINNKTSDYLGTGWTGMPVEKEDLISVKNQLSMSTGLDYEVPDIDCTSPECLVYRADAGTQWYYHNAPYTLLGKVLENATGMDYNEYTDQKLESITGMNGQWRSSGFNNVYWSTARDMARFGLLILNKGKWGDTPVITDEDYYRQMTSTSQELNPSYAYLWWLNGKGSIILPSMSNSLNVPLSEAAPVDLFAGMGKNGQFVEIIPGQNIVVVRMGEAPGDGLVPIIFHNDMWEKINLVLNK